jgi:hypothetical protein
MLIFVIDWESRDAHVKFMNDPSYGPFKARLTSLMEGVHLHHITQPKTALLGLAPVMEVATFYDAEPTMLQNVEKFAAALEKGNPDGFHGVVYGKVMEKIVRHAGVGKEDAKPGEAVVLLIGWDSKEIHLAFRETELFKVRNSYFASPVVNSPFAHSYSFTPHISPRRSIYSVCC